MAGRMSTRPAADEGRHVPSVTGIDHIAITVADLEASCAFYRDLFGARAVAEVAPDGKVLIRQMAFGGILLSIHQAGNGYALVARQPTVGAADVCFRWGGSIASAADFLRDHGLAIVEGPAARRTAEGRPSQSVYFRDPDGNLLELMAAD
jgi:catechol 2,3-dioxygenase-like lactoylglutathione lyase family enzyme